MIKIDDSKFDLLTSQLDKVSKELLPVEVHHMNMENATSITESTNDVSPTEKEGTFTPKYT